MRQPKIVTVLMLALSLGLGLASSGCAGETDDSEDVASDEGEYRAPSEVVGSWSRMTKPNTGLLINLHANGQYSYVFVDNSGAIGTKEKYRADKDHKQIRFEMSGSEHGLTLNGLWHYSIVGNELRLTRDGTRYTFKRG